MAWNNLVIDSFAMECEISFHEITKEVVFQLNHLDTRDEAKVISNIAATNSSNAASLLNIYKNNG